MNKIFLLCAGALSQSWCDPPTLQRRLQILQLRMKGSLSCFNLVLHVRAAFSTFMKSLCPKMLLLAPDQCESALFILFQATAAPSLLRISCASRHVNDSSDWMFQILNRAHSFHDTTGLSPWDFSGYYLRLAEV